MAQTVVTFRIEEELKKGMEDVCKEMGLDLTTAFTIFAAKVNNEKRIPFDVAIDPFYSEANMARLRKSIADVESGKAKLTVHELIEVENDD